MEGVRVEGMGLNDEKVDRSIRENYAQLTIYACMKMPLCNTLSYIMITCNEIFSLTINYFSYDIF